MKYPFAVAGFIIAILYAWSTFGTRRQDRQLGQVKGAVRTFGPSALVILVVLAVSAGLKLNLPRVDFGMFYSSALLLHQDPNRLYDPQKQTEFLHAVTGLEGEPHYLPFAYPPFVAFLFMPMAALSFRAAYYAMLGVNIAVLAFTLWWISSRLKFRQDQLAALLVTASAALPLYAVLVLGHLTFFGLLLLSLFVIDVIENRKWRTGLWAGLLLYKPILFPVPLLILLWRKQWKAIGLFILVALAMLLFSLALVGWSGLQANLAMLLVMTSDYLLPRTQSLRGLAFSAGLGTRVWIVLVVAALAALWIAVLRARDLRWVLAGAMISVMLIPPYLQFYDLSVGLICIAIALTTMSSVTDKIRNYLFLLMLVPPALVLAMPRDRPSIPIMPVALILAFAYCLRRAFGSSVGPVP